MATQGVKNGTGKRKSGLKNVQRTSSSSEDESEDVSLLGSSLHVSVNGVRQLIRAVLEGTKEFQEILYNDCSLVFECNLCRNLFRSVANFISHKRRYCKKPYKDVNHDFFHDKLGSRVPSETSSAKENGANGTPRRSRSRSSSRETKNSVICLEEVPESQVAKFQTVQSDVTPCSMQQELEYLARVSSPKVLVLSQDGRVLPSNNKEKHKCNSCDSSFPTLQTLRHHLALSHQTRTCYVCPLCKSYCSTPWAVYRHLSKIHNKSSEQVRKLRTAVLTKPVKTELHQRQQVVQETPTPFDSSRTEDEKWLAEFIGKLQCPVCRKTFTRQAALAVHSIKCKPEVKEDTPQNCNKCGKQFNRRAVLRVHQQSCKHDLELETRTCKYCKKVFAKRRQLEIHSPQCPQAPPKSPIRQLFTPSKLLIVQRDPSSPSDIQVRRDYKVPISRLNIPLPFAGKLENAVQKLRERPLFSNETVSIMTVQKASPVKIEPPGDKEGIKALKWVSVPRVQVPNVTDLNSEQQLNGTADDSDSRKDSIHDDCLVSESELSHDGVSSPFRGFDPVGFDDFYPREQIRSVVKKIETHMGSAALSGRSRAVGNNNYSSGNGINKHVLLRFNMSLSSS